MALPIPNLDDKLWPQLTDEARGLIPPVSPEWTDFNIHDPGITFIDLFAWLAEIQQYRLNRTSLSSADRMLSLAGVTRATLHPAVVAVEVQDPPPMLLPANTVVTAVGKEKFPFATVRDVFLTAARLQQVITDAAGIDIIQTQAEFSDAAYFEAFGAAPKPGDSLRLGFTPWFENEVRLSFTLFEDDLPPRTPIAPGAPGFTPSVTLRWEFLAASGQWEPLAVKRDGTLEFSQSGDVVAAWPGAAQQVKGLYWIRATLASGSFEIAPRIARIRVNVIHARQVKTIDNEDLDKGLDTPDQVVRLRESQLLLDATISAGEFQAGEVIDWQAMIMRLAHPDRIKDRAQQQMVQYIASQLNTAAQAILTNPELSDRGDPRFRKPSAAEIYTTAQAFDELLGNTELYQPAQFPGFTPPPSPECGECDTQSQTRRLNRSLLCFVFPDLIVSDRVEIQTGNNVYNVEDEPNAWVNWKRVDNFLSSAPDDRHFVLDPQSGEVLFGNGLNGRVPATNESVRARFYRTSQGRAGNLVPGQAWTISADGGLRGKAPQAAAGGADPEPLADAQFRSRKEFRSSSRAFTEGDFETLAAQAPGLRIAQVKVLPNFNPVLRTIQIPGDVTLVVVPFSNNTSQPPVPSSGFLATVKAFLEPRRAVTTRLFVIGPAPVTVSVSGQLHLKKGASTADAQARAQDALRRFLDPIKGGEQQRGWPLGRSVFPSEIYRLLARIVGVSYVSGLLLNDKGDPVPLPPDGLPFAGTISLNAVPFEQRNQPMQGSAMPAAQPRGCCHG